MWRSAFWLLVSGFVSSLSCAEVRPIAGGSTGGRQGALTPVLFGEGGLEVEILKGSPSWAEGTQRIFTGARWDFLPNGTFRFTPAAAADVRNDLFPLVGVYRVVGDRIQFQGTRRSALGASASLAGFLWGPPSAPKIVALQASVSGASSRIARIAQSLGTAPKPRGAKGWPAAPATFDVTLPGTVSGN